MHHMEALLLVMRHDGLHTTMGSLRRVPWTDSCVAETPETEGAASAEVGAEETAGVEAAPGHAADIANPRRRWHTCGIHETRGGES